MRVSHRPLHAVLAALGPRGVAHVVVERDDACGAGQPFHQGLDLAVVDALDGVLVVQVLDRRHVAGERESLLVERWRRVELPGVADRHRVAVALRVPPRFTRRGIVQIEEGSLRHRGEIVDRRFDHPINRGGGGRP